MSLKKWTGFYFRMPIKFKLTLWSTVLMMVLFVGYNTLQYVIMEKWIIHPEKKNVQHSMNEILNYFLEQEVAFKPENKASIRNYLDKINRDDQRIRIIGADNIPLITITNNVPDDWMEHQSNSQQEISIYRQDGYSLLIMKSPLTIFEFSGSVEI